jgi:hypothetical protein
MILIMLMTFTCAWAEYLQSLLTVGNERRNTVLGIDAAKRRAIITYNQNKS